MILVLTTPRTGSTWFCNDIAAKYSYDNLDEYFGDHELTSAQQVEKLEYIIANPNVVLKCFPWHFKNSRNNFVRANFLEKNLLKLADKIYILIRSNFNSQCKSYYLAKTTNVWSGLPQEHQHIILNQHMYDYAADHLKDGYQQLASYAKNFNCEIVEYETLQFEENEKYVRPVTWDVEPKHIEFDVKSLFA